MTSTSSGSPSATPSSGSPSATPDAGARVSTARARLGVWAEDAAADWYAARGCTVLARNWRCPAGELDLVVAEPGPAGAVVFAEVKARRTRTQGSPVEAVTAAKQRRVRRASAAWLARARDTGVLAGWRPVRFDVVGVEPRGGGDPVFTVVTDAF